MESYPVIKNTTLYQAFRVEGFPTHYAENKVNAFVDSTIVGIIVIFLSLFVSAVIIFPGFRGKERIYVFVRCTFSLLIGILIFVCNFEYQWENDEIDVKTQYKAGIAEHVNATIGLHIGLRGINITLKGNPKNQINEEIDYNEHFSWEWTQGSKSFPHAVLFSVLIKLFPPLTNKIYMIRCSSLIVNGSYLLMKATGKLNREYRSAQFRGLPYPILWIAEYFTFDGEGIRFGRHYRLAGYYTHILLWLAFPLWILSNILFFMVIQYGALFLILMGFTLLCGNLLFASIRNPMPLEIPFELTINNQIGFLAPQFSTCFYLNLFNGILCVILGSIAFFTDLRFPDETASFFGVDILQSYEDYYADISEFKKETEDKPKDTHIEAETSPEDNQIYAGLRKRVLSNRLSRLQRSTVRKQPVTQPRGYMEMSNNDHVVELPLYENFKHFEPIGEEYEDAKF